MFAQVTPPTLALPLLCALNRLNALTFPLASGKTVDDGTGVVTVLPRICRVPW